MNSLDSVNRLLQTNNNSEELLLPTCWLNELGDLLCAPTLGDYCIPHGYMLWRDSFFYLRSLKVALLSPHPTGPKFLRRKIKDHQYLILSLDPGKRKDGCRETQVFGLE